MRLHGIYKGTETQVNGILAKCQEGVALKLTKVTFDALV